MFYKLIKKKSKENGGKTEKGGTKCEGKREKKDGMSKESPKTVQKQCEPTTVHCARL